MSTALIDHGATGDGHTLDTAAIQHAFANDHQVRATPLRNGDPATYLFDATVTPQPDTEFTIEPNVRLLWANPNGGQPFVIQHPEFRVRASGTHSCDGGGIKRVLWWTWAPGSRDGLMDGVNTVRCGSLSDDWGNGGEAIWISSSGPIGSGTEHLTPHNIEIGNGKCSVISRNGIAWIAGTKIHIHDMEFRRVGGLIVPPGKGEDGQPVKAGDLEAINAPGAAIDIEPTSPYAKTPVYPLDGLIENISFDNVRYGICVPGSDFTGPVYYQGLNVGRISAQGFPVYKAPGAHVYPYGFDSTWVLTVDGAVDSTYAERPNADTRAKWLKARGKTAQVKQTTFY